jgi:1-acyl-sn-glycerol-3-phosphate acyltransferase
MRRFWVRIWKHQFKLRLCFEEHVPRDRPVIFVGNQASHYDGTFAHTIALDLFDRPAVAVADPAVWDYPFVRQLIGSGFLPAIRVEKDARKLMARAEVIWRMIDAIESGQNVVINPEGDPFDELAEFQPGAAYAAIVTGSPIVPFTLTGTRGLFPIQPWPRRYRGEVTAIFHPPVEPADFVLPGANRKQAANAMMTEVRRRVASAIC